MNRTYKGDQRFFEIPFHDQEVAARIVEAIPSSWSWVDGNLCAPDHLVESEAVQADTGFMLSRYHTVSSTIVGCYDQDTSQRVKPDFYAMLVEQKLPGFVAFEEAGYGGGIVALELCKRIITAYLRKGYRGSLSFFRGCCGNRKYYNSARCGLVFDSLRDVWVGDAKRGHKPARVRLEWNKRYGGKEEFIESIVGTCHSLGLSEYTPIPLE